MNTSWGMRPVVTLWETYGSGAATVDEPSLPRWGCRSRQHITSEEMEASEAGVGLDDSLLTRVLGTLGARPADVGVFAVQKRDIAHALREAGRRGAVGRNATGSADIPTALHVKLDGPLEKRLARGAARRVSTSPTPGRARRARTASVRKCPFASTTGILATTTGSTSSSTPARSPPTSQPTSSSPPTASRPQPRVEPRAALLVVAAGHPALALALARVQDSTIAAHSFTDGARSCTITQRRSC